MSETTKAESPPALANRPRLDSIPPLLASVRDYLQEVLPLLLRVMFEKTDDAFFELAEKAQIAAEQKIYFNAKKELRIKRRSIEASYLSAMGEVFHLEPEAISANKQSETQKILNDSSIDDPMFRVLVVLDEMVEKTTKEVRSLLNKVTDQINALLPEYELDEYNSPLSIYTLAENFLWACNCLSIETEEKVIFLNMFEKYVLDDIGRILNRVHRLLLDGEIASLASTKQKEKSDKNELSIKKQDKSSEVLRSADDDKKQRLMSQLIELQKESLARIGSFDVKQMTELVTSIAQDINIENDSILGKELQQAVELIRMLFNFILSENTSNDLSGWLIQLYLPLLRAVLIDVTVLSSEGHAVRRLLNEIAKAAVDVKPNTSVEDDLYRRYISRVVERVVREFDQDLSIFPELLVDFKAVIDDECARQKIINERMRMINFSEQKSEKAKAEVEKKIARICKNKKVPVVIVDFMNQYWKKVLYFYYLEEGDKSLQWNNAIDAAEFMVDSVLPENKGTLIYQLPHFLGVITKAMSGIGVTPAEISHFLCELEELHLQQYQVVRERVEKRVKNKPTVMPPTSTIEIDEEAIFESVVPDSLIEPTSTQVEPIEEQVDTREDRLAHAQQCVNSLKADMWLEFYPEPDKKKRVKIAAILKPSEKFIFVDRDGKKILEKNIDEMVDAVDQGVLKLLDADSLFGKALSVKRRV